MPRFRRRRTLGVPEVVGLLLVLAVVVPAWLWWRDVLVGSWQITSGSVVACDIRNTHYNAADYRPVVTLRYRYTVAGQEFDGVWEGLWPEDGSPNAIGHDQLHQLQSPGRPLVVYYNPADPSESSPHESAPYRQITYASATVLALWVVLWYFLRVFPGLTVRRNKVS